MGVGEWVRRLDSVGHKKAPWKHFPKFYMMAGAIFPPSVDSKAGEQKFVGDENSLKELKEERGREAEKGGDTRR